LRRARVLSRQQRSPTPNVLVCIRQQHQQHVQLSTEDITVRQQRYGLRQHATCRLLRRARHPEKCHQDGHQASVSITDIMRCLHEAIVAAIGRATDRCDDRTV